MDHALVRAKKILDRLKEYPYNDTGDPRFDYQPGDIVDLIEEDRRDTRADEKHQAKVRWLQKHRD